MTADRSIQMLNEVIMLAATEGFFDIADRIVGSARGVMEAAAIVLAIVFVLWTYGKTRAFGATLGAVVLAGIVLWAVFNAERLRDITEETIDSSATTPSRLPG